MPRQISLKEMPTLVGQEIGVSDWFLIDQARINAFAAATEDYQWIHVDLTRAKAEQGGTMAHGFLTLAMMPKLSHSIFELSGVSRRINYGFERLRFTAPVFVDSRIRLRIRLLSARAKADGWMLAFECQVEIEDSAKPALIAEWISVIYP